MASLHDNVRDPKVRYALPKNLKGSGLKRAASESADVADDHYIDGIVTNDTLRVLGELSSDEQPFFLAVGFRKPHLPFSAPKKYWDLYDREKIGAGTRGHPANAPECHPQWRELEGYSDIPKDGKITEAKVRSCATATTHASVGVDALIGKLLKELDRLKSQAKHDRFDVRRPRLSPWGTGLGPRQIILNCRHACR